MVMYENMQIILLAKKEPVSIFWQSIIMIIPTFDLFAAYRVEKLRKYLLFIIAYYIIAIILLVILFPINDDALDKKLFFLDPTFDDGGIGIGMELIAIGISIILIRKWSKEWNAKLLNHENTAKPNTSSFEILNERYAKGEITKEEFDKIKEDLN